MKKILSEVVFLLVVSLSSEGRLICHHDSYTMREDFCYRYVASSATYSQATERCERDEYGTGMLYIDSASENSYIWSDMFSGHNRDEFWLGLDDQANEGDFRWSHNKLRPVYANFSDENEHVNNDDHDCVKFSESGWQVASDFCENVVMPFVCKAPVCESSDGVICDEMRVREREKGGLSAGVIAAIVIIILVIICVIVVVVVLLLLWKFKNDTFRQYICPCVGRGSKQALMSLQQENQRLRQELNQSKMNTSTRFTSSGQFGRESVSGVPDGLGGMLPPLKAGIGGPRSAEPLSSSAKPPPLTFQRSTSRVVPMTPVGGPLFPTTPSVFAGQSQKPFRPSVSGGAQRGVAPLAPLKERENEDSSTTSEDDDASLETPPTSGGEVKASTKTVETDRPNDHEEKEGSSVKGEETSKVADDQSNAESKGQTQDAEIKTES